MLGRLFFVLFVTILLSSNTANAGSHIRSPYVREGQFVIEYTGKYDLDSGDGKDGNMKSAIEFEYGVNDWWQVGVESVLQDPVADDFQYSATEITSKFQFTERGKYYIDSGLYLAYNLPENRNAADKLETIWLFAKEYNKWSHRTNIELKKEVGKHSTKGLEGELKWQTMYELPHHIKAGFEYNGDFGEFDQTLGYKQQDHRIGPVVQFEFENIAPQVKGIELLVGVLGGISKGAPDATLRWNLEFKF